MRSDVKHWRKSIQPLIGRTEILTYPYGSRPTEATRRLLRRAGFDIQIDIDIVPHREVEGGVVLLSRRHVDGLAFEVPSRLAPFFSVAHVWDDARPGR